MKELVIKNLVSKAIRASDLLTIHGDVIPCASAMDASHRDLRFGMLASVATIAVFLVGGSLAPLESASVSHGTIMPSGYKKTIQHLEGGIIDAILVKDGDRVRQGQPLVRLSKIGASASQGIAASQYFTARVTQARLEALQNGQPEMALKDDMIDETTSNSALQDIVTTQQHLFTADRDAQRDKMTMYTQQIAQLHAETDGLKAQLASVQAQFGFISEALASERKLVARGLSTRPRLLSLEGEAAGYQGKIGEYTASIAKNEQSELEINAKISNQKNEFMSKNAQELRNARETIAEVEKKLAATSDVLDRTVIAAPMAGVVNDLKYHTAGGVITPGSTIMEIVPEDGALLVDAEVPPRDISRVHIGEDAKIMFSSYKSRTTPMIMGKVIQVSADRITPPASANSTPGGYYLARVEVEKAELEKLATPIVMTPGMPVEVMVVNEKRSLLSFYLKPFGDSFRRAFREQ